MSTIQTSDARQVAGQEHTLRFGDQVTHPSWCEECWEIPTGAVRHIRRWVIYREWNPGLKRWDESAVELEVWDGAAAVHTVPKIHYNLITAHPDEARKVAAAILKAADLMESEDDQ